MKILTKAKRVQTIQTVRLRCILKFVIYLPQRKFISHAIMEEDEEDFYAPSETVELANGSKAEAPSGRNGEGLIPGSDNDDRMDESPEEGEEEDEEDDSSGSVRSSKA